MQLRDFYDDGVSPIFPYRADTTQSRTFESETSLHTSLISTIYSADTLLDFDIV
jgi:hypothetical protein